MIFNFRWWITAVALVLGLSYAGPTGDAADGHAKLGQDPRSPANGQIISDDFGFAFMQNVQKTSPGGPGFTDTCQTLPKDGSNAVLTAIDGVASPENPEQIYCTLSGDTAIFTGRTGDCYYMVTGVYGGANGGGGGGGPGGGNGTARNRRLWHSEFDTNNDEAAPHFVVYINERYSSEDDFFVVNWISRISVELHNVVGMDPATSVNFKLSQTPLAGNGAVTILKPDGTPADPNQIYQIRPGETVTVNARGLSTGVVSIIAEQTN